MSPEFGATATLFPIDDETLAYLRLTGRSAERLELVERYAKAQGLWRDPGDGPDVRRGARTRSRLRRAVGGRPAAAPGPGPLAARTFRSNFPAAWVRGRRPRAAVAAATSPIRPGQRPSFAGERSSRSPAAAGRDDGRERVSAVDRARRRA